MRASDGSGEVQVPAYEHFSSTEVLGEMAMERMLAKLSTRRYGVGLEPVGAAVEAASSGKSDPPSPAASSSGPRLPSASSWPPT